MAVQADGGTGDGSGTQRGNVKAPAAVREAVSYTHLGLFTGSLGWEMLAIKASVLYLAYFFLYGCVM